MRFNYLKAGTIEEATTLLKSHGSKARVIAGGTDLMVQVRQKVVRPDFVIDIEAIPGLDSLHFDEGVGLTIGAATPVRTLETSPEVRLNYPMLSQAAGQLASVAIRNVGTVGGNLCNASPSADTAPALLALSAEARIAGPSGTRQVPLEEFFVGPGKTVLEEGELLVELWVPPVHPRARGVYFKHSIRGSIDLAIIGVAVLAVYDPQGTIFEDVNIALGAVAPTPMRAKRAEVLLKGQEVSDALIQTAAEIAAKESKPITDIRGTAAYRREMVQVFTRRALRETTDQFKNQRN